MRAANSGKGMPKNFYKFRVRHFPGHETVAGSRLFGEPGPRFYRHHGQYSAEYRMLPHQCGLPGCRRYHEIRMLGLAPYFDICNTIPFLSTTFLNNRYSVTGCALDLYQNADWNRSETDAAPLALC